MAAKTRFSASRIKIEPLSDSEDLTQFSCGNDKLDDFFHKEVVLCCKYKYLSAYAVKDVQTNQVICLFTLSNDIIALEEEDMEDMISLIEEEYRPIFQQQSSFPAVNIGHLAVRKELQSKGIGQFVITYIMGLLTTYRLTGVQFLTVDSLNNPRTNKFYLNNDFCNQSNKDINSETRRMYLPLIGYL